MSSRMGALIEPSPVLDDFLTGIATIQALGPCVRVTLYVDDAIVEAGHAPARIVRRKFVMSREAFARMTFEAAGFLAALSSMETIGVH
jgi:hypothetical protein